MSQPLDDARAKLDWARLPARADRVSADGTVIVGEGLNLARERQAFRAVLPFP
jgi:hypothetical protein